MGLFNRKVSDAEFEAEIKNLELEIEREKRKGELLKQRAQIEADLASVQSNRPPSRWGEFFQKMGELGQNMNSNLEAEDRAGRGWSVPDVSRESPMIDFNHKGGEVQLGRTKGAKNKKTKKNR